MCVVWSMYVCVNVCVVCMCGVECVFVCLCVDGDKHKYARQALYH